MTVGTFIDMVTLAKKFAELYKNSETGLVGVSAGICTHQPELHITKEAFFSVADMVKASISFKEGDRTRPCFIFGDVRVFCLISEKEAAERGYLTEAEAAFYGE